MSRHELLIWFKLIHHVLHLKEINNENIWNALQFSILYEWAMIVQIFLRKQMNDRKCAMATCANSGINKVE